MRARCCQRELLHAVGFRSRPILKILLCSHCFSPDIGGIETVSELLAVEFARAGHEVRVLTQTSADDGRAGPFRIVRKPGRRELFAQTRWCDVFFQNNISLQTLWPALLLRKRIVFAHHTWLTSPDGRTTWQTRVKRLLLRCGSLICDLFNVLEQFMSFLVPFLSAF